MSFRSLLTQTCDIERKTTTIGDRGDTVDTWAAVESGIPCNVQLTTVIREEYRVEVHGERSRTSYFGFFEIGTDIQEGDKVVMQDSGDSREFHVDRIGLDTVGRSHHMEAELEIL